MTIGAGGNADEHSSEAYPNIEKSFPVVAVGASAGGLEAFTHLLKNLPADTGMAFILIQHLAPAHESILTELLSKATAMPVSEVKEGVAVEPNKVYVIPPAREMNIVQGILHLTPRETGGEQHMPVDSFLRSLAEDRKDNSIAVIMSGTGCDGSLGVRAIKAEGGIVLAQDESAKYDGMPKCAVATGSVDFVLPPDKIAAELMRISRHPYSAAKEPAEAGKAIPLKEDDIRVILEMLRRAKGIDFSLYKRSTLMRRTHRRMLLNKIERIENYISYLKENPSEIETLYEDILINVTSFFREPEAFDSLKKIVFPKIVNKSSGDIPVRIWVPGCSTGEEVYSIAISLIEYMDDNKVRQPVQIFATDIDGAAIEKARRGLYPENISRDISPGRLTRFFGKHEGGGYVINKSVREMCIFARQNLVKDPPFSKIDLISCRNLLIYFGRELQQRAARILFYALNPKGFLMTGGSETLGQFADFFSAVDKKNTIYSRKPGSSRPPVGGRAEFVKETTFPSKGAEGQTAADVFDIRREADAIVLNRYGPSGFVVNEAMEILQFRGDAGPYLRPAPGKASLNLLKLVSEDLVMDLRTAIELAKKDNIPVRKNRSEPNETRHIKIDVIPFSDPASGGRCFLVLFEEIKAAGLKPARTKKPARTAKGHPEDEETVRLRAELASAKQHFRAMAEKYETAEEELRAMNEEAQSSNEELQSVNEELQTASEELQSTNEELNTVNDELQSRNEEATQLNNDLVNVLSGVEIPIVRLGNDLRIKRFNEGAAKLMNLIASDIERPIGNIRMNIEIPDLEGMALEVIHTLAVKEKEVRDKEGHWYSLVVRPYKTIDNRIEGVLMTVVDINDIKRNLFRIEKAYEYANAIVETVREPLLVLAPNLRVITANKSFYEKFRELPEEIEKRFIYELADGQWNIPALRNLLEKVLPENKTFSDFEVELELPNIGPRVMILNARKIYLEEPHVETALNMTEQFDRLILLAIEDITERKTAEDKVRKLNYDLQRRTQELEIAYKDMESFSYSVSHDLRAPLRAIKGMSDIVLQDHYDKIDDEGKNLLRRILGNTERMDQLVTALLEISRIGRQEIKRTEIDMEREAKRISADLQALAPERNISVTVKKLAPAYGDISLIGQVLTNLLSNAVKFTKDRDASFIEVGCRREDNENVYYVKDNGAGFDTAYAHKLFDAFQRLHSAQEFEGIGIGLSIVHRIIQRHGGRVWAEGETGKGATFYFTLPKR